MQAHTDATSTAVAQPPADCEFGDDELIERVRAGSDSAYAVLFERHHQAALRYARKIGGPGLADDLVSEAFTKVLAMLRRGSGPTGAFRAYLMRTVRSVHIDLIRRESRVTTLADDVEPTAFDRSQARADVDIAESSAERTTLAQAFAELPERWRVVLWHTFVEDADRSDIARMLGTNPATISSLLYRARQGLERAYVRTHVSHVTAPECRAIVAELAVLAENKNLGQARPRVRAHLAGCDDCQDGFTVMSNLRNNLGAMLAPAVLGGASLGASADSSAVAGTESHVVDKVQATHHRGSENPGGVGLGIGAVGAVCAVAAAVAIAVGLSASYLVLVERAGPESSPVRADRPASLPQTQPYDLADSSHRIAGVSATRGGRGGSQRPSLSTPPALKVLELTPPPQDGPSPNPARPQTLHAPPVKPTVPTVPVVPTPTPTPTPVVSVTPTPTVTVPEVVPVVSTPDVPVVSTGPAEPGSEADGCEWTIPGPGQEAMPWIAVCLIPSNDASTPAAVS
jgi:RNA polymerase sigma factor (sigma-70 family)